MSETMVAASLPEAPYRGLEPYRFCDQAIFFEREVETERLLRLITMYRGTLLYGASGVGKSSLINAGFIPRAIADELHVERLRVQPRPDQEFVVERIPRSDTGNDCLASILVPSAEARPATLSAAAFLAKLRSRADGNCLLIFDQFEELLTLASSDPEQNVVLASQERILKAIVELLQHRDFASIRVLFVFREDYLAKFDRLFYFCPELPERFIRLTPPAASTLHRLLRGPFETPSIPPGHWKREITAADAVLLEKRLRPTEPGRAINLSQVQIAALQLWRSDAPAELLARRGVDGLIEDFLAGQLDRLRDRRPVAERLLTLMITRDGTRRVVSESELLDEASAEGIAAGSARDAAGDLVRTAHLVRRDYNRGTTTYEIVSEFLVPWIRTLKLQHAAVKARNVLLRRAGIALLVIGSLLGAGYYWKYTTLSRDELVRSAQVALERAQAALEQQSRANRALQVHVGRLEEALRLNGAERERKLAEILEERTASLEEQRRGHETLQRQLDDKADEARRERELRVAEQSQVKSLLEQVNQLLEQSNALEGRTTKGDPSNYATPPEPEAEQKTVPSAPEPGQQRAPARPTYQRPAALQKSVTGGTAVLTLTDLWRQPLPDRVDVQLRHVQSGERREAKGLDARVPIEIAGLATGTYNIDVRPLHYAPAKASFAISRVGGLTNSDLSLAVDLNKGFTAEFPAYDAVETLLRDVLEQSNVNGVAGRALYERLDNRQKAGLFNLFAKMSAFQMPGGNVWTSVKAVTEVTQEAIRVRADRRLLEFVRVAKTAARFQAAPQPVGRVPTGYAHAGSFKSNERRGLLQLSFFDSSSATDLIVDAEIDVSNSGIREALRGTTDPYVVHQILWTDQNVDPLYRLVPARK
jgi:hypothetical protein